MITAADLGKASVEPLQAGLLVEFSDAVRAGRTKRYIGHVVRQVMEFCSYQLDRQNVKIGNKILFKTGSPYAKTERRNRHSMPGISRREDRQDLLSARTGSCGTVPEQSA